MLFSGQGEPLEELHARAHFRFIARRDDHAGALLDSKRFAIRKFRAGEHF